ncbi:MAG TPA: hypothetical protein VI541_01610 [Actinomycetota bacterium]|nr:hypothetical protein [Actinomycetota bacterium]
MRRRVGWVTFVVLVGLGASIGAGLPYLSSRQRAELPRAAEQLRLATTDVAEIFSCFEGAQDDLFSDSSGASTAQTRGDAARPLNTCTTSRLIARRDGVRLPISSPLSPRHTREAQKKLRGCISALRGVVTDVARTQEEIRAGIARRRLTGEESFAKAQREARRADLLLNEAMSAMARVKAG